METSEQNTKQSVGNNHIMDSSVSKQSPTDYTYEDDFEELDTFINEKTNDTSESSPKRSPRSRTSGKKDPDQQGDSGTDTDIHEEKGQRESSGQIPMEKDRVKERTPTFDDLQSDDSEPEAEGDVLFTQDQQRAMMELMAQKHDSGDYAGDPHEYNVKQRLKELNEELAKEPEPDDRQHRVGFKKELVDLVAPAPEVSEDEDDSLNNVLPAGGNSAQSKDSNSSKQYVVERDGKFDIVEDHELSASERAMFNIADDTSGEESGRCNGERGAGGREEESGKRSSSATVGSKENRQPQPPSKPRPNTANGSSRRSVHVIQSPRPRTASSNLSANGNYGALLQDFNYSSPYAMSSTEKERAQERARLREQQKKEEERRRREEDEYRRQESEDAFQAWLQQKADDDRRKRHEDEERKRRDSKDDKSDGTEVKENDEAFRGWLRQKQVQQKREKLLKRREEQGVKESYYVRSREECDMAYKDWLKKKYAEFRQQRAAEKERQKSFLTLARKARKQQMIARAVRHSQAFRFTDVFDYRF